MLFRTCSLLLYVKLDNGMKYTMMCYSDFFSLASYHNRATSRQNQQTDLCVQRGLFPVWSESSLSLDPQLPIELTAKSLIRLGRCPGWSESSLGAQIILLVLLWGISYTWTFLMYHYTVTEFLVPLFHNPPPPPPTHPCTHANCVCGGSHCLSILPSVHVSVCDTLVFP